jgi:hypothetical protein
MTLTNESVFNSLNRLNAFQRMVGLLCLIGVKVSAQEQLHPELSNWQKLLISNLSFLLHGLGRLSPKQTKG